MSYAATIPVQFGYPRHKVYEAMSDLGRHPMWNSGMISISQTCRMYVGLEYVTTTNVLGRISTATVQVVELIPDKTIVLESHTGLVTFRAVFQLDELTALTCSVVCSLQFKFSRAIFNIAQPVAEAVAESRIQGDLEALRDLLG